MRMGRSHRTEDTYCNAKAYYIQQYISVERLETDVAHLAEARLKKTMVEEGRRYRDISI